jgi:hypothetical protein
MAATSRLPPELVDPIITLACIAYVDSLILNTLIVDEEEARRPEGEQVRTPQPLEPRTSLVGQLTSISAAH